MGNVKIPRDVLPTLVIGLGGTGYQVIKRSKELFNKRYNGEKMPIRYLLIDTDLKTFLDDNIENTEKCQLRFGEGIKNTLDWAYSNPNFQWLPKNPPITPDFFTSTDQGAGLVRPIGRLYLCKNSKQVYDALNTAKNDLVDLYKVLTELGEEYLQNIDRHKVYIVGSLAGGTGCGTFLDVAVMLSKIFNRDNTNIIGMFTLQSCYDDKLSSDLDAQKRSKANCYAALKELEFYMSSIKNPEDERYTFKYSNVGEIKLEKKLLDVCYVLENKNEMGGLLSNIEDIYSLCALQLFQEVGTTLGSQLRADYANFICKDKDPFLKKDRNFSTFSSSSMEFPMASLKEYCSYRFADKIVKSISGDNASMLESTEEEASKIINNINSELELEDDYKGFTTRYRVSNNMQYAEVKTKINNLSSLVNTFEDNKRTLKESNEEQKKLVSTLFYKYINENIIELGINNIKEILNSVEASFYEDYDGATITSNIDKVNIVKEFEKYNEKVWNKGKAKNSSSKDKIVISINKFIEQEIHKYEAFMFEFRYNLVVEAYKEIKGKLDTSITLMNDFKKSTIDMSINKMKYKSSKKYGGNIISRDIISKDFYENFYMDKFETGIKERIKSVLKGTNVLDVISKDKSEILTLCNREFNKVVGDLTIINVLQMNADYKKISLNEYVKNELEVTSKLARPFWTAVKNPEVSWTECYYIGALKDSDVNDGFTIKAPEAIDNWIRNQTGKRSRQAKYVETTNPYAIDMIHITMGACAEYLPEIKNYRQHYLKLLASKTYPLHLSEKYIGISEIDEDMNKLFNLYSIAKAFGVFVKIEGGYIFNIENQEQGYKYKYLVDSCYKDDKYLPEIKDSLPNNKSNLEEDVKYWDSYEDLILGISEDVDIIKVIEEFMENIQKELNYNGIKTHCLKYIENYVKDKENIQDDFIAYEKLNVECQNN